MRRNKLIDGLEGERPVFLAFSQLGRENAVRMSASGYDGVIIDMEHTPFDMQGAQDYMQYLLDPQVLAATGPAPSVTPIVRIAANGAESNEWMAKQVLDAGSYGVVWPHIDTAEQARHAVSACRYPAFSDRHPDLGSRGCGPFAAARYMGVALDDYYATLGGVWPLDPSGEILVVIMIESGTAVTNIRQILTEVPGIGAVFVGPGDLSQSYGMHGLYSDPVVTGACAHVLAECQQADVACGITATEETIGDRLAAGYQFLVVQPRVIVPDFAGHMAARQS